MDAIELAVLLSLEQPKEFVFPDDLPEVPTMPTDKQPFSAYNLPWLYALSKKGTIRTYRIEVSIFKDRAVLSTLKRVTETGVWQTDSYEYTEGVNIGKSNETTFAEQAINEANSLYKKLLDDGYTPNKPKEGEKFNTDANGSMKPMLAKSDRSKIKFPCIVQPKYDGVRCLVFEKDGEVQIISRKGKSYNIPHLKEWAEKHRDLLPLDGELYNHKELTFQEIVSAVKKQSEITPKIRYVVYDRPIEGVPNNERWDWLLRNFYEKCGKDSPAYLSGCGVCHNLSTLMKYHDARVKEGYEGAIARNRDGLYEFGFHSNNLIKIKEFKDAEYEIIDVVEASGRDIGTAIFVCKCDAGEFNVKPQGTRELRAEYFKNRTKLIGKMVTVKYQELSDDGIPRFPSAIAVRDYE